MSIARLVLREIYFRKLSCCLGVLAVAVAVGCLVSQLLFLQEHDLRTQKTMAKLEDDIRVITKNLGFNIRILPREVNLADFFARDYADKYMPESYADKLAGTRIVTINHLLPMLQQRSDWPEQKMAVIILTGIRGEVPIALQDKKKPIRDRVPPGKIVLGYHLHRGFKPGDELLLHGRKFTVHELQPKRGDQEDITAYVPLKDAQELFGKKGLINGMLALGCNCTADRMSVIRKEIEGILPDTQVEEFETKALARAEARNLAATTAQAARDEREAFAAALVPIVLLAACVWLGLLALANVRERRGEIGLLRALGLRSGQLLALFLSRAVVVGLSGAVLGAALGLAAVLVLSEMPDEMGEAAWNMAPILGLIVVAAPIVSALASWLPALVAVKQDPAEVLQGETA